MKAGEVLDQRRWPAGLGGETVIIGWAVGVDRIAPIEVMARK